MAQRIHIIADSVIAGDAVGRHNVDLVRALQAGGNEVYLYYDSLFTRNETDIRALAIRQPKAEAIPDADVTILQYAGWYPLAERFKMIQGTKIFWYHGVTPPDLWGTAYNQDLLVRSRFGARLVQYAHLATADSPYGGRELHDLTGYSTERILPIPIGTDTTYFSTKPQESALQALRKQLAIGSRQIMLYVGRLAGNKRVDLLVGALYLLRDTFPELCLIIVGDDSSNQAYSDYAAKIRSYVTKLNLSDRVILTGKVPSVQEYYHIASVFVLASEHEGFGVPLVEAMAAGVPVVASGSASIPWVLDCENAAQGAGLLFRSGDVEDLAEKIAQILGSQALAENLREKGLRRSFCLGPEQFQEAIARMLQQAAVFSSSLADAPLIDPFFDMADVALREYQVRSNVPILGKAIEWVRINSTSHIKEAYIDRIVERQVMFNLTLADRFMDLQRRISKLANADVVDLAASLPVSSMQADMGLLATRSTIRRAIFLGEMGRDFRAERTESLLKMADVALPDYRIHSKVPLFGKLIEWIRYNLTVHVKEVYLDRIIEKQVDFNLATVQQLLALQNRVTDLEAERELKT